MRRPKRRVGVGLYTNVVLTIIASCLLLLTVKDAGLDWSKRLRTALGYHIYPEWQSDVPRVQLTSPLAGPKGIPMIPVRVFGTVDVNVGNTVDVDVANTVDVNVANTVDANVTNTVDVEVVR